MYNLVEISKNLLDKEFEVVFASQPHLFMWMILKSTVISAVSGKSILCFLRIKECLCNCVILIFTNRAHVHHRCDHKLHVYG